MRALVPAPVLTGLAFLAAVPGGALGQEPPAAELTAFAKGTRALPSGAGTASQRRGLARMALAARHSAKTGHTCSAIALLARYRRIAERVEPRREEAASQLAGLATDSVALTEALLSLDSTRRCGGGIAPSTLPEPRTTVLESDARGMRLKVELPDLRFLARTGLGQAWTKLVLPLNDVTDPGEPGIPVVSATFGVPSGAGLDVSTRSAETYAIDDVAVFPTQPQAADQVTPPPNFAAPPFAPPPFTINPRGTYDDRRAVPPRLSKGAVLGTARDVRIGRLEVPSAQWNPASGRLRVVKSVKVTIRFTGGSRRFSGRLASPWEAPQRSLVSGLINADVVRGAAGGPAAGSCGEEMLVITNPATLAAANQLADARRAAGLRTSVVQTGGAVGTKPAQIQRFIRGRLSARACIRPSYVTLLGDDRLVPTFHSREEPFPDEGEQGRIASDLPYSTRNDADELPDVAVGRIVGGDQTAVANAVAKIVRYESSPPGGPTLGRATVAAMFQDDDDDGTEDRTFVQNAEIVRTALVARGVQVDRIYHDDFSTAPRRLHDGTELPPELLKPGFAWRGDGQDVTAAWNEGRFLIVHRDHGWSDGWGHPAFDTARVQALTNGERLPVLMSINCSSGAYDRDETSFAKEALVKPGGGAVGVFGDTRDSPSSHNTQIALGFADALLPNVIAAEGPVARQRMGNALVHGKLRLAGRWPPTTPRDPDHGDSLSQDELHLWHYFGDPSMQIWGGGDAPVVLDPAAFDATLVRSPRGPGGPPYEVRVALPPGLDGQTVSLLRDGQAIGKAFAAGGAATIAAAPGDADVDAGRLRIALEPDGSPPVAVPVRG
ncbi:MAG TPA: C25 family cysteine peptidase [Thermoleophilaceae bacterium]